MSTCHVQDNTVRGSDDGIILFATNDTRVEGNISERNNGSRNTSGGGNDMPGPPTC